MSQVNPVTTHVLDTARGSPAQGVPITLEHGCGDGTWNVLAHGTTNSDGRISAPLVADPAAFVAGVYRMTFDTKTYFTALGIKAFYPSVTVVFEIEDPGQHYHVPLLLSPYGYSTYRGS
jgi:5-hydroxyisourate hydrolase